MGGDRLGRSSIRHTLVLMPTPVSHPMYGRQGQTPRRIRYREGGRGVLAALVQNLDRKIQNPQSLGVNPNILCAPVVRGILKGGGVPGLGELGLSIPTPPVRFRTPPPLRTLALGAFGRLFSICSVPRNDSPRKGISG